MTLIVLFALMIFLFLCNFMSMGIIGTFFSDLMFGLMGFMAYFFPVFLFAVYLYYILMEEADPKIVSKVVAVIGLFLIVSVFAEMAGTSLAAQQGYDPAGIYSRCVQNHSGGGIIGGTIAFLLYSLLKTVGMVIVLLVLTVVCIYVIGQRSFLELFRDKAIDARDARRERREEEERYRREHPEEFEEDYGEYDEYGEEEYYEEPYEDDGRKEPGQKTPGRGSHGSSRSARDAAYRQEYREEEGLFDVHGQDRRRRTGAGTRDQQDNVKHFHGIVGSTDLSEEDFGPAGPAVPPADDAAAPLSDDVDVMPADDVNVMPADDVNVASSDEGNIPPFDDVFENPFPARTDTAVREENQEILTDPASGADRSALFYSPELHEIRPEDYTDTDPLLSREGSVSPLTPESQADSPGISEPFEEPEKSADELHFTTGDFPFPVPEESFPEEIAPEEIVREEPSSMEEIPVHTEREAAAPERDGKEEPEPPAWPLRNGQDRSASCTLKEQTDLSEEDSGHGTAPEEESGHRMDVPKEYEFPPLELLQAGRGAGPDSDAELRRTAHLLESTLSSFGVNVRITDISQGPSVTRYEMLPETGVKVSRIVSLADDIKLALAATDIRIEAPIPGKSAIGIEVPNRESEPVMLRDIVESQDFRSQKSRLAFAVGKDIAGKPVCSDIAKMPHVLIAGATGSGKSVCINTIIMSILYHARPDEVKFIMIDPKVVELSVYNGIPHLLIPVVTNPQKATAALNWAVAEMESRYRAFADAKVRDIRAYNAHVKAAEESGNADSSLSFMPQIVVIVDELADLMMVAKNDVETAICRLAQLARAAGIHLIIATQRPSVDVITGLIKANMPSRIAFRVSSGVDSRTILDMNGAEKLLGKGDMLFFPQGYPKPTRVQGCFVSDEEVNDVTSFLIRSCGSSEEETRQHQEEVDALEAHGPDGAGFHGAEVSNASEEPPVDEFFGEAGQFIIEKNNASIGLLQRRYRIGFNRAARIMDQLCEAGVVGESEGTKSRNILMTPAEFAAYCAENGIQLTEP